MKFKIQKGNQVTTIHESDCPEYLNSNWEIVKCIPETVVEQDELEGIMFPGNEMSED